MDLIDFARTLPQKRSDRAFINHLLQVLDLEEIKNLSDTECQNLFDAAQFLVDYLLLQKEFYGVDKQHQGHIMVDYSGPYIENQLTRPAGAKPKFEMLETFGVADG